MDRIHLQLSKLRQPLLRPGSRQLSPKLASPAAYGIAVLFAIGIGLAAATTFWGLGLMVFFPALSYVQPTRCRAFVVAGAYYAAAANIIVPSATALFGSSTTLPLAVTLWAASSGLLAVTYAFLWSSPRKQALWRLPVAILATVLPPLGLIGWASPLTAAGVLYPGTGSVGLTVVLLAPGLLVTTPVRGATVLAAGAIIAMANSPGEMEGPSDWETVSTSFRTSAGDPIEEYQVHKAVQQRLLASYSRVIIFGETVVSGWTEATETLWGPALHKLLANGQTVVFGATIPIPNSARYRNVILLRGAETAEFDQQTRPVWYVASIFLNRSAHELLPAGDAAGAETAGSPDHLL